MPLGRFLHTFCWDLDWECPIKECGGGSSDHIRSFLHNKCRLNIAVDGMDLNFEAERLALMIAK